jgi:stage II sporulation protein M
MPDYRRILWDGRRWLISAVLLFLVGIVAGLFTSVAFPDESLRVLQPAMERLREVGQRVTSEPSPFERTSIIFRNNGLALLWMMLLGLFAVPFFGLVPAAGVFGNGAMIGIIVGLGSRFSPGAASPGAILLATLPHGIIEIPALWIGTAWGMKLGLAWLLPGAAGHRLRTLGRSALEAGQIFVLVSVLLIIAAAIEANVTLAIVQQSRPTALAAGLLRTLIALPTAAGIL